MRVLDAVVGLLFFVFSLCVMVVAVELAFAWHPAFWGGVLVFGWTAFDFARLAMYGFDAWADG